MTTVSTETLKLRANRGVALLDEERPSWFFGIRPESIEMMFSDKCVLGSLEYGLGYLSMMTMLCINDGDKDVENSVVWYGFDIDADELEDSLEPYSRLTDVWRNIIAERQIKAGVR